MLSEAARGWLTGRGLSIEVAERMGTYSGKRLANGEVRPDVNGDILVFPTRDHGKVVNEKYRAIDQRRDGSKPIWQKPGGKRTFYNVDALDHPSLANGSAALVIVEGEPDLAAVLTAGYEHVVSVPDGAPPAFDQHGDPLPAVPHSARLIVVDEDRNFSYLRATWQRLKPIKRIVMFVDNDAPGERLRDELVRRLGRVRCYTVKFPKGCKDANDVLQIYGAKAVRLMIDNAVPMPIGPRLMSEFRVNEIPRAYSTGWPSLDLSPCGKTTGARLMLPPVGFVTLLGRPGDGKSTWVKQLAVQLAKKHGWRTMLATFEEPESYLYDSMLTLRLGKPRSVWSADEQDAAREWIDRYFCFVTTSSYGTEDGPNDIDWMIEQMSDAMGRYGSNVFIIDPWNELEHSRRRDESHTEYTGRAIKALKQFAATNGALVIVCVHPTKDGGMRSDQISLYDADGSAHWANKPDVGIIMYRDEFNRAFLKIRKLRFSTFGEIGDAQFNFDRDRLMFYA